MVPYQRNPHITGRDGLLTQLNEKLCETKQKRFNHRIAIYGIGGVGKTQVAIEYIYRYRVQYDGIYWISASDQAALLSGFQEIGSMTGCVLTATDLDQIEVAKMVLSWLRRKQNWLVVIDNLETIEVVDGFLPETGLHQHTLITTRNPNAAGIPAEGVEVPLLEPDDAIDLLSTLSNVTIMLNSPERKHVAEIVQKLGNLPLAIEQASAYVREVTGDFVTFIKDYERNHKDLLQWVPQGN